MTSILGTTRGLPILGPQQGAKPRPGSIVVLDRFTSDGEESQTHGESILELLHLQGFQSEELVAVDTTAGFADFEKWLMGSLENPQPDFFRRYVEGFALAVLGNTNQVLQQVVAAKEEGQDIGAVTQSQGISTASLTQQVLFKGPDSRLGATLAATLPQPETPQNRAAWVSKQIEGILKNSEDLALQLNLHAQLAAQLSQMGVSYGVAAGNTGRLVDLMQEQGVKTPADFETNLLAKSGHAVVVGGFDDRGTLDPSDDHLWEGSSEFAEVDLLASHRSLRGSGGTSFALPKVMGALEKLRRQQPELGAEERLRALQSSAQTVAGSPLGAFYTETGL